MKLSNNDGLSHVYGLAGLVPAIVGLIYLFKTEATWSEYALFGSGWGVATVYALMLMKAFTKTREDGERVGYLTERVANLTSELANRSATLDYLAGLQIGKPATRRKSTTPAPIKSETS